jgi:hypothetical protein
MRSTTPATSNRLRRLSLSPLDPNNDACKQVQIGSELDPK